MADDDRGEIVAALRKEEERVSAVAQEAREKAKTLEKELKGIRSALAALTGQPNRPAAKKAKKEPESSSSNGDAKPPTKQRKRQAQVEPA